jgi:hypothetical protein
MNKPTRLPKRASPPAKTGRPSAYSEELAEAICESIACGHALYRLCEQNERWPSERTIYRWLEENIEFRQMYMRARERCADRRAEELVVIADTEPDPQRARVMIEARKWHASKLAPKKYGDKVTNVVEGGDKPVQVEEITDLDRAKALAALLAKVRAQTESA